MIIYSGVLFMAIFWYRKILSSLFIIAESYQYSKI